MTSKVSALFLLLFPVLSVHSYYLICDSYGYSYQTSVVYLTPGYSYTVYSQYNTYYVNYASCSLTFAIYSNSLYGKSCTISFSGTIDTEESYDFTKLYYSFNYGSSYTLARTYSGYVSGSLSITGDEYYPPMLAIQFTSDSSTTDYGVDATVSVSCVSVPSASPTPTRTATATGTSTGTRTGTSTGTTTGSRTPSSTSSKTMTSTATGTTSSVAYADYYACTNQGSSYTQNIQYLSTGLTYSIRSQPGANYANNANCNIAFAVSPSSLTGKYCTISFSSNSINTESGNDFLKLFYSQDNSNSYTSGSSYSGSTTASYSVAGTQDTIPILKINFSSNSGGVVYPGFSGDLTVSCISVTPSPTTTGTRINSPTSSVTPPVSETASTTLTASRSGTPTPSSSSSSSPLITPSTSVTASKSISASKTPSGSPSASITPSVSNSNIPSPLPSGRPLVFSDVPNPTERPNSTVPSILPSNRPSISSTGTPGGNTVVTPSVSTTPLPIVVHENEVISSLTIPGGTIGMFIQYPALSTGFRDTVSNLFTIGNRSAVTIKHLMNIPSGKKLDGTLAMNKNRRRLQQQSSTTIANGVKIVFAIDAAHPAVVNMYGGPSNLATMMQDLYDQPSLLLTSMVSSTFVNNWVQVTGQSLNDFKVVPGEIISPQSGTTNNVSPTSNDDDSKSKNSTLYIAIGAGIGGIVLLMVAGILYKNCYKRSSVPDINLFRSSSTAPGSAPFITSPVVSLTLRSTSNDGKFFSNPIPVGGGGGYAPKYV